MSDTNISEKLKQTLNIIGGSASEIMNLTDGLDETGDVEPRVPAVFEIKDVPSVVVKDEEKELSDVQVDYIHARNITYTLIDMLGSSLAGALRVAEDSEHPRAYSVVNELAGTMRELAQDLLALQKSHKDVVKGTQDEAKPQVVNNTQNNFNTPAMSTTDVIKMAMQLNKNNAIEGEVVSNG